MRTIRKHLLGILIISTICFDFAFCFSHAEEEKQTASVSRDALFAYGVSVILNPKEAQLDPSLAPYFLESFGDYLHFLIFDKNGNAVENGSHGPVSLLEGIRISSQELGTWNDPTVRKEVYLSRAPMLTRLSPKQQSRIAEDPAAPTNRQKPFYAISRQLARESKFRVAFYDDEYRCIGVALLASSDSGKLPLEGIPMSFNGIWPPDKKSAQENN